MFRLIFWLLFGQRRPLIEDVRHLSTPIVRRQAMTTLLHADKKEDFILVIRTLQLIVDRFDGVHGQRQQSTADNVRPLPQNQNQNSNHNNNGNQRR